MSSFIPGARALVVARHLLLASLVALTVVVPASAQQPDRTPPTITFEPLGEGRRGDTQVFSARVEDEEGPLERVTFHFRPAGTSVYAERSMTPLSGTDIYTVSIDDLGPDVTAVEFYIDAVDEAGNRSIEGFAFDPLERVLVDPESSSVAASAESTAPIEADGISTRRKIVYGVLGLVAVGALAAALSSDDGDDDGGGDGGGPVVPVTVVADPPQ